MMIILPIIAIILLYLFNWVKSDNVARALANTWITAVAFVWFITEFLSVFGIWTKYTIALAWVMLAIFLYVMLNRMEAGNYLTHLWCSEEGILGKCKEYKSWLISILSFTILILILSCLSSQTNADTLYYHLPRIMHWIQNKSVGHYATDINLQIRYPALAEYLVAQILLFTNNSRLANMIQTIAYFSSTVMIFGISRRLNVSIKSSFIASWIYLMLPMALAQSLSAQTDDIAGMFLLVYVYFILDFIQRDKLWSGKKGILDGMRLAACVMYGYLCKPTICFVMVVFFIWMCLVRLRRRDGILTLLKYSVIGIITAAILYMPLFLRSYHTYISPKSVIMEDYDAKINNTLELTTDGTSLKSAGNALAPDSFNVTTALKDPRQFIMVCLKNIGKNASSQCFPKWNELIEKAVIKVGKILNCDASDYSVSQSGILFFYMDTATNPAIMIFMFLAVACILLRMTRTNKEQTIYAVCSVLGFVLQCALMGYTIFRTRYLVGAMAVFCPGLAVTIDNLRLSAKNRERIVIAMITIACFGAVNSVWYQLEFVKYGLGGSSLHQYFSSNYKEYSYAQITEYVTEKGYTDVGIDGVFQAEYVLWKEFKNLHRMENVNVEDVYLSRYEDMEFHPKCLVKESQEEVKEGDIIRCHGMDYQCEWVKYGNDYYYSVYTAIE